MSAIHIIPPYTQCAQDAEILGEVIDMGAGRTFTAKDPEGHYIQVFHLYPQVREMQGQMGMSR
jgi:hypothetical protein